SPPAFHRRITGRCPNGDGDHPGPKGEGSGPSCGQEKSGPPVDLHRRSVVPPSLSNSWRRLTSPAHCIVPSSSRPPSSWPNPQIRAEPHAERELPAESEPRGARRDSWRGSLRPRRRGLDDAHRLPPPAPEPQREAGRHRDDIGRRESPGPVDIPPA